MPRDPYRNFKFEVVLDGFTHAGFSKVTGLKHTVQVIDYREGGENERMRKLPGQSTFDAVTFERGSASNNDFVNWIEGIFNLDGVDGVQPPDDGPDGAAAWRRDVIVYLKNKSGVRVKKWTLFNAWPSEKTTGDLDAAGNDVLIETLVLQNEGIKEQNLVGATA